MSYIGNSPIISAFPADPFSGNGSTTAFTLSVAPANTNSIIVVVSAYVAHISGLAIAAAFTIPNLFVFLLALAPAEFIKRISAAAMAIFYVPFLAGFMTSRMMAVSPNMNAAKPGKVQKT